MPGPQTAVPFTQPSGFPGEWAYDSTTRCFPWTLFSAPNLNIIGATAYTEVSEGVAQAGGVGAYVGVLVDPKAQYSLGVGVGLGALAPTMAIPDNNIGELATTGIPWLVLSTAGNIGDQVGFLTATGVLQAVAAGAAAPNGVTLIPNAKIILRNTAANGLAIVQL